jgi:hypothetical protein
MSGVAFLTKNHTEIFVSPKGCGFILFIINIYSIVKGLYKFRYPCLSLHSIGLCEMGGGGGGTVNVFQRGGGGWWVYM